MQTKYNFTKFSISEFEKWIAATKVARTVVYLQQHHTYSPNYALFKGNNHFELQKAMKTYHMNSNGWADIGQHFTTFPDGTIVTGRSLEKIPACIYGNNSYAICIENLGNFDKNADSMTMEQVDTIIRMTAAICKKFNIPVNTDKIVYHHWFNLSTVERNNGNKNNKSCPGTNFFGGNKVADCQANFLPKVKVGLTVTPQTAEDTPEILKYVQVTASSLNIRNKANATAAKVSDREAAIFGAVLRVYKEQNGWYKISSDKQHWVSGKYTKDVLRASVTADVLNVRNGASVSFLKIGSLLKNDIVFVNEEKDGWCKIALDEQWINKGFLKFS